MVPCPHRLHTQTPHLSSSPLSAALTRSWCWTCAHSTLRLRDADPYDCARHAGRQPLCPACGIELSSPSACEATFKDRDWRARLALRPPKTKRPETNEARNVSVPWNGGACLVGPSSPPFSLPNDACMRAWISLTEKQHRNALSTPPSLSAARPLLGWLRALPIACPGRCCQVFLVQHAR